jgi:hypothetical protein
MNHQPTPRERKAQILLQPALLLRLLPLDGLEAVKPELRDRDVAGGAGQRIRHAGIGSFRSIDVHGPCRSD